jgi:hypothetical protein
VSGLWNANKTGIAFLIIGTHIESDIVCSSGVIPMNGASKNRP